MTSSANAPAHIDLPLRGLASEGIAPVVRKALLSLPGVLSVEVREGEFFVRVGYDPGLVGEAAIRQRLHDLGGGGTHSGDR